MSASQNKQTLISLFENLGPGIDTWLGANSAAMTEDCTWWMQGWPLVVGLEEMKYQILILQKLMGVNANPILEWRNIQVHEGGKTIYFERRGSFADINGETITDWDISGIFEFNDQGKIYRIRDYFDNTGPYQKLKGILQEEQIAMINQLGRQSHPLAEGNSCDPDFYRKMYQELIASQPAGSVV